MDERDAVIRLQTGEIDALEPLVRRYQHPAMRAAYLITGDRQQAEDIVQTAFVRAIDRVGQLRAPQAFGPWFLRGVVNDATRAASRAGRQVSLDADTAGATRMASLADPALSPADLVEDSETREELWELLGALPPEQRGAVVLKYYLELTDAEVAERLHAPTGTIKWRLHAARRRLRQRLAGPSNAAASAAIKERSEP